MRRVCAGLLLLLLTGACAPQPLPPTSTLRPAGPSATPAPSNTPEPTPTPLTRRTLPPTWTLDVPTPTPDFFPLAANATPAAFCAAFAPDSARNVPTFVIGTAPVIYWLPLDQAWQYRVRIYNPQGEVIFTSVTGETRLQVNAAVFTEPDAYAWEVLPMNQEREQLCPSVGSLLLGEPGSS